MRAIVSAWLNPAAANLAKVVSKSVYGPGTPDGPAESASILPTRRGMLVLVPPQLATDAIKPFETLVPELGVRVKKSY